jgi:hypothetical protein
LASFRNNLFAAIFCETNRNGGSLMGPEILAWERRTETERDTRRVELGRYLCEVRAGQ